MTIIEENPGESKFTTYGNQELAYDNNNVKNFRYQSNSKSKVGVNQSMQSKKKVRQGSDDINKHVMTGSH